MKQFALSKDADSIKYLCEKFFYLLVAEFKEWAFLGPAIRNFNSNFAVRMTTNANFSIVRNRRHFDLVVFYVFIGQIKNNLVFILFKITLNW